jgi:hypothetical protein
MRTLVRPALAAAALAALASAALAALASAPAAAQSVSGGDHGLKGRLVSRSVTAMPLTDAVLYTAEPKGFFVLTQFCWADASAGDESLLSGSVLGPIATDRQSCRGYDPGLVFGPNEVVTCANSNGFSLVCTITGVQTSGK